MWKAVTDDTDNRIAAADVRFIGNQYATYDTTAGKWKIAGKSTSDRSVFGGTGEGAAAANVTNLTIGSNLVGIGDYAFYGCTNINNINLGNGLNTLGNYAFANCRNLNTVGMDYNTNLTTLGAYAFANCDMLKEFALPTNVTTIGDFCFMNCANLKKMDMTGKTYNMDLAFSLKKIGYKAFMGCSSLESLTLPKSYDGADKAGNDVFHLSTVQGCTSLKFISTPSQRLQFVTDAEGGNTPAVDGDYTGAGAGVVDGSYDYDTFKADVGDEFYFEGPGYMDGSNNQTKTPVHNIANVRHICFKYIGEDRYEIVEPGVALDGTEVGLVFEINSPGDLQGFRIEDPLTGKTIGVAVPEITMPEKIGPYAIKSIIEGSFNNNCWIEKVTIPASVVSIGANAFKGSHNLKHIIFSDAANITNLGTNAFATQVVDSLHDDATANPTNCKEKASAFLNAAETPFLSFTGKIEKDDGTNTEPFKFAMKSTSKINAGEQRLAYITYYSGMPSNLTVKYNPDTQMSELQYFPTKEDVQNGFRVNGSDESAADYYNGAYRPHACTLGTHDTAHYYRFPYLNDTTSTETMDAFGSGTLTENQIGIKDGVQNIVIPNGVNSIKEGLFSGLNEKGYVLGTTSELPEGSSTYKNPALDVRTITVKSVAELKPYTFARMYDDVTGEGLTTAYISGATKISDYVFDECEALKKAEISADTTEIGKRPFSGCINLEDVTFPQSTTFTALMVLFTALTAVEIRLRL